MSSLNQITLIGNVGRDPEVKILPSGDRVANFSLATSEKWNSKDGEKQERTEWHKVDAFGKLAEIVESYVSKGSKLFVQGQLVYDEWTDKDGNKRTAAKVKLGFGSKLVLLGSPSGDGSAKRSAEPKAEKSKAAPVNDDDIPF